MLRAAGSIFTSKIRVWSLPLARAPASLALRPFFSSAASAEGGGAPGGGDAPPPAAPDAAAAAEAASLRAELDATRLKLKDALESRAYLAAEAENARRIAKLDVEKARAYAAQPIAKGLLLAVDNLAIAQAALTPEVVSSSPAVRALAEGVGATSKIFLKVLGEHGVAQFGAAGEKFNPNVHEAVSMQPAPAGAEPNTIMHVLKTGFMFKDRVLRPAQVIVAVKAQAMEDAAAAAAATEGSSRTI
jgi:molecular chaperone GrpE